MCKIKKKGNQKRDTLYQMNVSDEISLLRRQRMKSIEECNFAEAKEIELQISKLQQTKKEHAQKETQTNAKVKYNIEREDIQAEASSIYNKYYNQVAQTRSRFQTRKTYIQQTHGTLLSNLATEYAKELEVETTRAIPEADTLKREAQIRAKNSDYEIAEKLFKESIAMRESVTKQRQGEVHKKYDHIKKQYEMKHEEELKLCSKKEVQAFTEIKLKYDTEISRLDKKLTASSLRLGIQREDDANKIFKDLIIEELDPSKAEDDKNTSKSPRSTTSRAKTMKSARTKKASSDASDD
jgi:hypothetical protein